MTQNDYYYKKLLQNKIDEFLAEVTQDENELGYISENMNINMTEAAWLIIKQNFDTNKYFNEQVLPSN